MKAYISADFEGVEGILSSISTIRSGPDYGTARKRLARGVNAAVRACFDKGFDDVTVCDGHADMENLLLEDLDPRVRLISGAMRQSLQMQGIEEGYDAFIAFGHAGMGLNVDGVLNHCYNGAKIYNLRLNGRTMNTETVVNAAIAGHYGIPLIAIIGDDAVCREVREFVPEVEGIVVKKGFSRYSAISVHPEVAEKLIYDGVGAAITKMNTIAPLRIGDEITMEVDYINSGMADSAALIPGVERVSPRTVRYTGPAETIFRLQVLLMFRLVDVFNL